MPMKDPRTYTLVGTHATFNPTDSLVYYFGGYPSAPTTTAYVAKLYIPRNGIIRRVRYYLNAATVGGTNEQIQLVLRKANMTDFAVANVSSTSAWRMFSNSYMNVPVAAGDAVEFKLTCPAWVTNPTGCLGQWVITIECP